MPNSKSTNKSQKDKATKLQLTDLLIEAIQEEKLIVGESTTGDWLALLDDAHLIGLMTDIERLIKDDIELKTDLLSIMLNLLMLEAGHVDKIEILESELFERFNLLFILCQFEKLSRDGLIANIVASRAISGVINRSFSYDLTPNGIIEARKEAANPILVSRLKAMNNSPGILTEESKTILMRIALHYGILLEKKELEKVKAMLEWAKQKQDPLTLEAINLINSFFAEQLNTNYFSLPQNKRLSFFLDNPQYVKEFFSSQVAGSLSQLIPQNENLPQKLEDLYSKENTLLFDQYLSGIEQFYHKQSCNKEKNHTN